MIDPKAMDAAFGRVLSQIAALLGDGDVIAIDGHALRAARDKGQNAGQGARTRMMVSAYATRLRLALATVVADNAKTGGGELEAALEVPGLIALKGKVVTADALNRPGRSETPVAHALSEIIAIPTATRGGVQHLALDFMGFLRGVKAFRQPPGAFTGAAEVEQKQDDGERRQQQAQRFARQVAGEDSCDPADHRCPRFQSSIRAWMATTMPISATAMNTQRRASR